MDRCVLRREWLLAPENENKGAGGCGRSRLVAGGFGMACRSRILLSSKDGGPRDVVTVGDGKETIDLENC